MEQILNNRIFRIVGIVVGIPSTVVLGLASFGGIFSGYSGLIEGSPEYIFVGILTITSAIGIFGIWNRILNSSIEMKKEQINRIRKLLIYAIWSCLGWLVLAMKNQNIPLIAILFSVSFVVGAFLYGTPKKL